MPTPDRLTLIGNLLLAMPIAFFLPGFALSKTFLKIQNRICFSEMFFFRVFLSFVLASYLGLAAAFLSMFTNLNVTFGLIVVSFILFLFKRFRFISSLYGFRPISEDFAALIILFGSMFVVLWPSENIGSTFSIGTYLARTGSLKEILDINLLTHFPHGLMGSVWIALTDSFFGLRISLLTLPVLGVLSLLILFFLARRLFGFWGGVTSVFFMLGNFTAIWYYRLSENYVIAQLLIVGALYLTELYFSERNIGFMILSLLSVILCLFATDKAAWIVGSFVVFHVIIKAFFQDPFEIIPAARVRFLYLIPSAWFLIAFNISEPIGWAVPWIYWIMGGFGGIFFLWKKARIKDILVILIMLIYPIYFVWSHPREGGYMMNLSGLIPVILPSVSLFTGSLMDFFSKKGKMALAMVVLALGVMLSTTLYSNRHLLFFKDHDGVLKFYENLRKSFLPNDLIFSSHQDLSNILWRVYGLKVYDLGEGDMDKNFLAEIHRWLKQGGKAYVLQSSLEEGEMGHPMISESKMEGFALKLERVDKLRTPALEKKSYSPPEKKVLEEISIKVYEALSMSKT